MEAAFIYTEDLWAGGFSSTHPLKPDRLKRTFELLVAYRAFDTPNSRLVAPVPATGDQGIGPRPGRDLTAKAPCIQEMPNAKDSHIKAPRDKNVAET